MSTSNQSGFDSLPVRFDGVTPLRVNWAKMNDHAIGGFTVYRSTDGVHYNTIVGDVPRDQYSDDPEPDFYHFLDETAVDGNKYWYRIRPYYSTIDEDGNTTITQHLPTTNEAWRIAALKPPSNVHAVDSAGHTMLVTWDDDSSGETGYRVELRAYTPGGVYPWTLAGVTDSDQTAMSIDSSMLGTASGSALYEVRVTSTSDSAEIESAPAESAPADVLPASDHIDTLLLPDAETEWSFGPKETYSLTVGNSTHAGHTISLSGGGAASTVDEVSKKADADGKATFTFTGQQPGADIWTVTDLDSPPANGPDHAYYTMITLPNRVTLSGGVALVEDDTQSKTVTITRDLSSSPTSAFKVTLSLVSENNPDAAEDSDVSIAQSIVSFAAGDITKTFEVKVANNDDKAEGLETIYVRAVPDGGDKPSTLPASQPATQPSSQPATQPVSNVGFIDDDTVVRNIKVKLNAGTQNTFSYDFSVNYEFEGEHLDRVAISQGIKASTRIWNDRNGGVELTPAQVFNQSGASSDVVVNTPANAKPVSAPPDHFDVTDPNANAYTWAVDTDWEWALINATEVKKLTPKDKHGSMIAADHQQGGGAFQPVIFNTAHGPERAGQVNTRSVSLLVFFGKQSGAKFDVIAEKSWSYDWSNINCQASAQEAADVTNARGDPNNPFVKIAVSSRGNGQFTDPAGLGLAGLVTKWPE